jgi:hypothetical protein
VEKTGHGIVDDFVSAEVFAMTIRTAAGRRNVSTPLNGGCIRRDSDLSGGDGVFLMQPVGGGPINGDHRDNHEAEQADQGVA